MNVTVVIFGQLASITGHSMLFEHSRDTDELVRILHSRFPELAAVKYQIAVNRKLVHENTPLNENCEVALLPPFSGG